MRKFIEGLHILSKHCRSGLDTRFFCQAEHDCIFFTVTGQDIPEDSPDGEALLELGFHLDLGLDLWAYFS